MSYVTPTSTTPIPGGLTLVQFIQSVLVGISGLNGTLVRPRWQISPPKQPDISVNWLAFGIEYGVPNANAYTDMNEDGEYVSQRHQDLKVRCAFYGPDALDYANIVTDGFQIPTNLEALYIANMGFVSTESMIQIPDLVNERWVNRVEMGVNLRREIQRVYPVPYLLQAKGAIHATIEDNQEYDRQWQTQGDT